MMKEKNEGARKHVKRCLLFVLGNQTSYLSKSVGPISNLVPSQLSVRLEASSAIKCFCFIALE
jgi:hypothetical protein